MLLRYRCGEASGIVSFGDDWRVRPSRELLEQLEDLLGSAAVRLVYSIDTPASTTALAH